MVASVQNSALTVEDYLVLEQTSLNRHEYVAGQIYCMAGGSEEHDLIAGNVYTRLRAHLRGQGCRVFSGNMKIYIQELDTFYYPDVSVVCDPADTGKYFKKHPKLLVEVLSPGTERIDRNEKLMNYRQIASLEEYVLISQTQLVVEIYRRNSAGAWQGEVIEGDGNLTLASLGLTLSLADIYDEVTLA
ncbi:MAG: Uma2 family endonuclease [Leptolyngbyaceae cyanobacterium SM2_5_2]|nr:Uma2 family endonuclease [Leptolyngbyaceae cyanobacterium SM2_5_2]